MIKILNLKKYSITKKQLLDNPKFRLLNMLALEPATREQIVKNVPNIATILSLRSAGYIKKEHDNRYYVTEDGLDFIEVLKLEHGIDIY